MVSNKKKGNKKGPKNKKSKKVPNSSTRLSGYKGRVNLGVFENVYNRSTKLIQSPNLYSEKVSSEQPVQKKKRKSHGLNKMIVEFQQNFLSKKPKPSSKKTNLQKLVRHGGPGKAAKTDIFDKTRSFAQKMNHTVHGAPPASRTYHTGVHAHLRQVHPSDFKELQNSLLSKVAQKANLDQLLELEKRRKNAKGKSKRKSLTANSWYKSGRKSRLLKRYSKKLTQSKLKRGGPKAPPVESGDSGISFGDKEAALHMAKSETVPGLRADALHFQSSSDNKAPLGDPTSNLAGAPPVRVSRCVPSLYVKSHSEFEANDSGSIFSPKIDKDFVLSKEDNVSLSRAGGSQNQYHFQSNPHFSVQLQSRPEASLKNLDRSLDPPGNIYQVNSIEKLPLPKGAPECGLPGNFSNYSNYIRKKSSTFAKDLKKFKGKINSSNNLSDFEKEVPSFQPSRNRSFLLKQRQRAEAKKGKADRNREGRKANEVLESIHQDIEKFNIQSKTSIENSCLKGLKSVQKIRAKIGSLNRRKGDKTFKSLKKEKPAKAPEISRSSSTMVKNPFGAGEGKTPKNLRLGNHNSTKNINIFGKEESRDILSEKSESYVTVAKYKKQHLKAKMNRSQDNYFNLPLLKRKAQQKSDRANPKSSKDSTAFLTPEVSEIKINNYDMSFNCFSNAGVSFEMPVSAQENATKSHSDSRPHQFPRATPA